MKKLILTLLVFGTVSVQAQNGSPYLDLGNDIILHCGDTCTTLHADYLHTGTTNVYTVSPIQYNPFPYNAGTPIIANTDDIFSSILPLPFSFCFFGTAYSNLVVGSNGIVSFQTNAANSFCNWSLSAGPIPTAVYGVGTTNSIMCAYQDIDPTYGGNVIRWIVSGSYPNRKFVVSYDSIPYFGDPNSVSTCCCPTALFFIGQVVLYETTNVIDIYIRDKENCTGWNGGLAIEGIQNATGTVAYAIPGRNDAVWTASNDAWRFTPSGTGNSVSINWFNGSSLIGTGDSVSVCTDSVSTYTAQATYPTCSTSVTVTDAINVSYSANLGLTDLVVNESCAGCNDGIIYATAVGGSAPYSYSISPSAGNQNGGTFNNLPAGTYLVCATDSNGCSGCDSIVVGIAIGINEISYYHYIKIAPNPTHSTFNITLNEEIRDAELKIFDVTGRVVHEQGFDKLSHRSVTEPVEVTVNCQLNAGVYFVKIQCEEKMYTQKLVVE